MKIEVNQIPPEGMVLAEEIALGALDLETDLIKFSGPVKVKAKVDKITNAVTVHLNVSAPVHLICSRCLEDFKIDFKKDINLNYPVSKNELSVDLDPDIREEIILDYPIKPLCKSDCRGLCPKCGKNLNQGGCSCGTTEKTAF